MWDENSDFKFQSALQSPYIQDTISCFLSQGITDINAAAENLNQILLDSAKTSLKVVNNYQNNSSRKLYGGLKKRKHLKHKSKQWFDMDLKAMRSRVIANGKLYCLFKKEPYY